MISYIKSAVRMIGCGVLLANQDMQAIKYFALIFCVAEILGFAEEWFDERGVDE